MLIAVIGGKLQGVEAVYLAGKAGYSTLLIDKKDPVPAKGLCDYFVQFDVARVTPGRTPDIPDTLPPIDLILPALEDIEALEGIQAWAQTAGIPLAFDMKAFRLTASKQRSDTLFRELNLPAPRYWPACRFPVVAKPDSASGSKGVRIFRTPAELARAFPGKRPPADTVIQEYVIGPSFSIEVLGIPGNYQALQVTELGMAPDYDCCRITAPADLESDLVAAFEQMALTLAQKIQLKGIMDLEVILHDHQLKLLEIDARLPSQTPMTVFHSSGYNMVEALVHLFTAGTLSAYPKKTAGTAALVEHIRVADGRIDVLGEGIMSTDGALHLETDFFGVPEALTSFSSEKKQWVATLIFTGSNFEDILAKKKAACQRIVDSML